MDKQPHKRKEEGDVDNKKSKWPIIVLKMFQTKFVKSNTDKNLKNAFLGFPFILTSFLFMYLYFSTVENFLS